MISRRSFLATTSAVAAFSSTGLAIAKGQPVKIVVGFTPGGSADFVARLLAQDLAADLGVPVIVENRPGAGGRIAVEAVKNAKPDGNTLLVTPASMLTIYPHVYEALSYNPLTDLAPVASLCALPYSASVGPLVPANVRTLKDFGLWIKDNPQQASYGTPGAGTAPHFLGAMLANRVGAQFIHVPYKGGPLAVQDAMAGQIASSFNVVCDAVPFTDAGKLRVLGVTSQQRIPQIPNVATFAQQGMPEMTSQEWFGLFAPKGTDQALINRLYTFSRRGFSSERVQKALFDMAYAAAISTPEQLMQTLQQDIAMWEPVVKKTGFKAEG